MRLNQLKRRWSYLSHAEKIELITNSNERRLEAFEVRIKKNIKKPSKRKTAVRKKHTTVDGMMELIDKMSPEQLANFKLLANTHGKNTN